MANLEGMPIGSLPEATDIQDEDEIVVYRPSTGKAYQANTDLIDSLSSSLTLPSTTFSGDCDDLTDPGIYKGVVHERATNGPGYYCYFIIINLTRNPLSVAQIAIPYNSVNPIKTRSRYNGDWTAWT